MDTKRRQLHRMDREEPQRESKESLEYLVVWRRLRTSMLQVAALIAALIPCCLDRCLDRCLDCCLDRAALIACCFDRSYNFTGTFDRTGSNLTVDGSKDDLIKLQGLEKFEFTLDDASRDAITGEFAEDDERNLVTIEDIQEEVDDNADEGTDGEAFSAHDGSDSGDGGDTTDADNGPDYEVDDGYEVQEECPLPCSASNCMDGVQIAHRFEDFGWAIGLVRRKVMLCIEHPENNGRYATKYPDSRKEYYHDLYPEDYGIAKMWVVVRPCGAQLNSENYSNSA